MAVQVTALHFESPALAGITVEAGATPHFLEVVVHQRGGTRAYLQVFEPIDHVTMNYLAHGLRFIEDPYFLAGTAVPDWLSVVDRRVRARAKVALPLVGDADDRVAAIARGIVQHHTDDDWFHRTAAFAELSWKFTVQVRDVLGRDDGLRPSFLGHILVELLLDAAIARAQPSVLRDYYAAIESIDGRIVQDVVSRIAARPAAQLAEFIDLFCIHRFLFDYADDERLLFRLNQIMRRVGLAALPPALMQVLPAMRSDVHSREWELLAAPASC